MGVIETEILQLVIGVPKLPGDTRSAEQGIRIFPLILYRGSTGFTIKAGNRWQPSRPALKDQWHESALTDGRTLAGVVVGNVRETITLRATAANRLVLEANINTLSRFINQARSFFATFHQIEPVYLEWAALGGKGSQYALIYTVDMSVTYDDYGDGEHASADIQLVIEREPAWRGVPPGVSPRAWTLYTKGKLPGAGYTYSDLNLSSTGALVEGRVYNRNEYSLAVDDGNYPSITQNWIDIPAASIPGDAPALCSIYIDYGGNLPYFSHIFISRITKPGTLTARETTTRGRPLTINATDCALAGASRSNNATHGMKNCSTGTQQIVQMPAGANSLSQIPDDDYYKLSLEAMRGKYNVFIRGYFSDNAPPTDGVTLTLSTHILNQTTALPTVYAGDPSLNAGNEVVTYLGQVTIPAQRSISGIVGGLHVQDNARMDDNTQEELYFSLQATVKAGETYNAIDLVFVPFDEQLCAIAAPDFNTAEGLGTYEYIIDNTGYLVHGNQDVVAYQYRPAATWEVFTKTMPVTGNGITLEPGITNRLAFILGALNPAGGSTGDALSYYTPRIDIVPRWYGVRDT